MSAADGEPKKLNFIEEIIEKDRQSGKWDGRVQTRFPPEPNGYLHIGHAKSVLLNHGLADRYGGRFNLRFDDTNPVKEEDHYVHAIVNDIRWLGARWEGMSGDDPLAGVLFASDYFDRMYAWAEQLVEAGDAYVDDQTPEQIRENRGTLRSPGKDSPFRDRSPDENLDLLRRMKAGEFPDGSKVLRARIDMQSPNLNLRDPIMYRILHAAHHRTGDAWCLYPMYDWAHGLEDSIEGITHSICTLEFENHRPLYDWFLERLGIHHPQQIEFARLSLSHTVMSKRKLRELVEDGTVAGWDDPRMPTLAGLRRRGYTPESIREFCTRIGVAKFDGISEMALLEHCLRQHLNQVAPRFMAVLNPLKVVITNYPDEQVEHLDAVNNPEDPSAGTRQVPFSKVLYIERDDFMEDPPRKFFRLAPGREVRLRYAYFVTCTDVIKDDAGNVIELHCTYDPATRGGDAPDGRKVKGTLHWVAAAQALAAEVRLYETLFTVENPNKVAPDAAARGEDWRFNLNPNSLKILPQAWLEPALEDVPVGGQVQFERLGYFCCDADSNDQRRVFNRAVTLKDAWARISKQVSK